MKKNFLLTALILSVIMMSCVSTKPTNSTIFKTDRNKELIDSLYNKRLESWTNPYQILDIETSYGRTNIIVSGKEANPHLFLIHAMGVTATMWLHNIHELSKSYRVYAINTIGDIGKSEHYLHKLKNHPKNGEQYANWLAEICDSLKIASVHVAGASMGGWISLNFAVYQPERVEKLILLGPMGLKPNYLKVMGKLFKVVLHPSEKNKKDLIAFALGNNEAVVSEMYDYMMIATNCAGKLAPPKRVKKKELRQIKATTLLVLGAQDKVIGDPARNEKYAKKYISGIEVITLPSGHLINVENAKAVNEMIVKFISKNQYTTASERFGASWTEE